MTKSIRTILMPLLIINYAFGLRIVNLSRHLKLFTVLYMMLIWSIYYFFATSPLISSFFEYFPIQDNICYWLESFTTLLSIVFGVYHEKKFQNCLRKFDIVDNTLLRLGTITNYDKLCKRTVRFILGWFLAVILSTYSVSLFIKNEHNRDVATSMFFMLIRDYSFHLNFIGDLTIASILEYIRLKFDQINEHLHNMTRNNKIKQAWENSVVYPHEHRFSKTLSSKYTLWIIIHLHLELRKISREIDSIFGMQMTFKMACYFGWIANDLHEVLYAILVNNYVKYNIMSATLHFIWFSLNVFKFLLINYMCEIVSTKAQTTVDLLNKLLYSTCDIEVHQIYCLRQFRFHSFHCGQLIHHLDFVESDFSNLASNFFTDL
ncbi:PREDICTED: uncharacterized protein LOC105556160 isoform X2 [Vollenhovia emeryi]|uniref:uncharacterized protein LOC105556160 isoform X2 n=1 Tax=Vollenhovia emeryi TaxID=411798 RepID=UPI0005F3D5E9|nr:PREDICTED: uncharacterized protein LOC105556160 isoform X2 [Vollenhovia emeryi]